MTKFMLNYSCFTPQLVRKIFNKYGVIHIINTGMSEIDEMKKLTKNIINEPMTYQGGANSRSNIAENVYDVGAPLEAEILFHHEMAYVNESPSKIAFCCESAPKNKGWTYISDQVNLTKELLTTPFGKKLFDKGVCYTRILTDKYEHNYYEGVYNHWQTSFNTHSFTEVVLLARKQGLEAYWDFDNKLVTKYYQDAFEWCPETKSNLLFSSLADHNMWFDTWDAFKNIAPKDRPLQMSFRDGTEFTEEEIKTWQELYHKYSFPIRWQPGDVAIICNHRWAHGRPPIYLKEGEERKLGVVLGDVFKRKGQKFI